MRAVIVIAKTSWFTVYIYSVMEKTVMNDTILGEKVSHDMRIWHFCIMTMHIIKLAIVNIFITVTVLETMHFIYAEWWEDSVNIYLPYFYTEYTVSLKYVINGDNINKVKASCQLYPVVYASFALM